MFTLLDGSLVLLNFEVYGCQVGVVGQLFWVEFDCGAVMLDSFLELLLLVEVVSQVLLLLSLSSVRHSFPNFRC